MDCFQKVFIEFVTISCLFYVMFFGQSMWDLGFPAKDQTHTPCIGRWSLNHWTTREVPVKISFITLHSPSSTSTPVLSTLF